MGGEIQQLGEVRQLIWCAGHRLPDLAQQLAAQLPIAGDQGQPLVGLIEQAIKIQSGGFGCTGSEAPQLGIKGITRPVAGGVLVMKGIQHLLLQQASAALTGKPSRNYFGTADQPILHPDALQTPQVA